MKASDFITEYMALCRKYCMYITKNDSGFSQVCGDAWGSELDGYELELRRSSL